MSEQRAKQRFRNPEEDAALPADTAAVREADHQNDLSLALEEKAERAKTKTKASLKARTKAKHPGVNVTSQGKAGTRAGTILEGSPQPKGNTIDLRTSEC